MAVNKSGFVRSFVGCAAFAVVLVACPMAAHAANNCPWLNEATASGFLAGNATGDYLPPAAGKAAICTFTRTEAGVTRELIITVEIAANPHDRLTALEHACGAQSEPLQAVGNEAVQCATITRNRSHSERVIGRVRDQVFTIDITTTAKQDPVLDSHELVMRSMTAAAQVSGNLF